VLEVLLSVLYAASVLPAKVIGRLLGRDSLLLRRPRRDSYWLAKASPGDVQSYFSPGSAWSGNGTTADTPAPMARWIAPMYLWLSRAFAPRRARVVDTASSRVPSAASRDQAIPDEIYTLW
jgi:hypothetical protein